MPERMSRRLLTLIAVILSIWFLRWSASVSLPLAFALLAIAAVWPLKQWLCRFLPEWLSLTLTLVALLLAVGAFALALYLSAAEVLAQLRSSQGALNHAYRQLTQMAAEHGIMLDQQIAGAGDMLRRLALDGYSVAVFIGFVVVLVGFGLPEVTAVEAKLHDWLSGGERHEVVATVDEIADKVRRYLWVTLVLSALTGFACWAWGYATGLELAVTWGLLNFLLNFVPIVGNVIGIIPPSLYAFAQFGSAGRAALVFAGFAVIQLAISNLLNPWLQGRSLSLSPFVILLAIGFWAWLWGIGGALLAVPITAAAAIICGEFDRTRWIALLIARQPRQPRQPPIP